jgi:hypothetical protein
MSSVEEIEKPKNYNFFREQVWPARKAKLLAHPRQRCKNAQVVCKQIISFSFCLCYRSRWPAMVRPQLLWETTMAKAKVEANWVEIDVTTLHADVQEAYAAYKQVYAEMKAIRKGFEERLSKEAGLPEGKRMVFGYNFGKLSVAIVDDDRKPAKATPAKQSLADFIAAQQASGKRV